MLEGIEPPKRKYICSVGKALAELEQSDSRILQEAINDIDKWTSYGLSVVLKERGLVIHDKAIRNHRAKGCQCWKT